MAIDHDKVTEFAEAYTAAWNSGSPEAVAEFPAQGGRIVIDHGEPWEGPTGVAEMAASFFAEFPDLTLVCDKVRSASDHVVYLWTFTGTHSGTKNPLRVVGWEESNLVQWPASKCLAEVPNRTNDRHDERSATRVHRC